MVLMNNDSPWNDVKTGDDSYYDGTSTEDFDANIIADCVI